MDSDSPTTNYASNMFWYVEKYSSGGQRIGYNKINQITGIPSGAVITQASFRVQGYGNGQPEDVLTLREVTSSWNVNDITYNTRPSVSTTILDYERGDVGVLEWDITELVKKWVQNPSSNYGVQISYVTNSTSNRYKIFYKMSAETLADRPYYEVRYQDTKGVEDYYNYYGCAADGAGNGYVNAFTGQLSFLHNSLSTTDSLMPYTFGLAYNGQLAGLSHTSANSASAYSTAYAGKGFKLYSDESIKMYASVPYFFRYVWMDADGTEHYFIYQDDVDGNELKRRYVDEDGLKLTLIVTVDEEDDELDYLLTDDLGNEKGFDINGRLVYIKDANGNKRTFNRSSGKLTSISLTPNGFNPFTQLSFTYNSSNLLQQVSNEQNEMTADFYYSATYNGSVSQSNNGFLRKIVYTYSEGYTHTVTFEYDSSGRLTVAKDLRTGKAVGYTYNTAGLVSKITEYANATESNAVSAMTEGQSASIVYDVQKTTYSAMGSDNILGTADDLKTVYQFDHTGKVISAYSHIGNELYGASNYVYESEESIKTKNSLASVLTLGGSAVNLLCDPGFDNITNINSDSNWSVYGTVHTTWDVLEDAFEQSVNLQITDSKRYANIEQAVTLSEGSYTFSVMVNPDGLTENARVRLIVCDYEYELWENSDYLYWQDFGDYSDVASEWEQLSVTFDVPSYYDGHRFYVAVELDYLNSSNSGICTAVIDSAMLERGKGASTFSLLGNGAFEQGNEGANITTDWSYSTGYPLVGGMMSSQYCAEVFGNALLQRSTQTTLNLNHTQSTLARSFVVSGWGKANSAKTKYPQGYVGENDTNPVFAIKVVVTCYNYDIQEDGSIYIADEDDTYDTVYYIPFNDQNTDWQFASGVVNVFDGECLKSITVHACYDYNVNQAYFDDFSIVENSGAVTNYTYNENGYLESAYASDGTGTTYTYAPNGVDVSNISNSAGGNYRVENDDKHRVKCVINSNGNNYYNINYLYNDFGQVTGTEMLTLRGYYKVIYSASTYATNNAYFGATLTETDPTGATTEYYYDYRGRLQSVCDANGNGLTYSYNQFGQLSSVEFAEYDPGEEEMVSPMNAAEVTNTYNNEGRLATITTDTATYTFVYDEFGNTTRILLAGRPLASYEYKEKNGVLLSMDYGNGCSVEYLYDGVDRIIGICYNGSTEARFAYTYNANGNVTRHEDLSNGLEYQYSYDGDGKLQQTTVHKTGMQNELFYLSKYEYDDQGRVNAVYNYYCTNTNAAPLSFTTYEYDVEGNVKKVSFNNSASVDYTRDYFGRLASKTLTNSTGSTTYVTQSYSYATHGTYAAYQKTSAQVSKVTLTDASGTEYTEYSYDAVGNITGIRRYNSSGTLSQYSYEYDELGQLTRENIYIPSNTSASKTLVYAYDKAGNILSKTTYPYTTGTLGTATSTINYQYTASAWGDLMTQYNQGAISYDAIGNALNLNSYLELRWEGRQLKEIYDTEDHYSYTYAYNDEGVRISKDVDGVLHEYVVEGTQIQREVIYYSNSSTPQYDMRYFYDAEGNPTSFIRYSFNTSGILTATEQFYYGTNLQGDIVAIYNSSGSRIYTYEYDAWGNVIRSTYANSSVR